jgi:hypothetical protein
MSRLSRQHESFSVQLLILSRRTHSFHCNIHHPGRGIAIFAARPLTMRPASRSLRADALTLPLSTPVPPHGKRSHRLGATILSRDTAIIPRDTAIIPRDTAISPRDTSTNHSDPRTIPWQQNKRRNGAGHSPVSRSTLGDALLLSANNPF